MSSSEQVLELAGRYADGAITPDEMRELETALRTDPALRRTFIRYMNIDATLAHTAGSVDMSKAAAVPAPRRDRRMAIRIAWWGAAAALVSLSVVLWQPGQKISTDGTGPATAPATPPVVLIAATNARWADPDAELLLRSGDMPATMLRLESGVAEFRFTSGATAVLLGPASVRFDGPSQMFLEEGKTLCRCPTPESRITVSTPATQVADLGTEFAVDAPSDKQGARVAVIKGEVRVGTTQPKVLRTGETARIGLDRIVKLEPLPPEVFAELFKAQTSRDMLSVLGTNSLLDPQFAAAVPQSPWYRTEGNVDVPQDGTVAVHARSHRFWPGIRQKVETGDIGGQLVVGSVDAMMPPDDPLRERQWAILKILFIDNQAREFATSFRYFLRASDTPGQYVTARAATFAPPGTCSVQIQILLNARGLPSGTVWFKNPRLAVIPKSETDLVR